MFLLTLRSTTVIRKGTVVDHRIIAAHCLMSSRERVNLITSQHYTAGYTVDRYTQFTGLTTIHVNLAARARKMR